MRCKGLRGAGESSSESPEVPLVSQCVSEGERFGLRKFCAGKSGFTQTEGLAGEGRARLQLAARRRRHVRRHMRRLGNALLPHAPLALCITETPKRLDPHTILQSYWVIRTGPVQPEYADDCRAGAA